MTMFTFVGNTDHDFVKVAVVAVSDCVIVYIAYSDTWDFTH